GGAGLAGLLGESVVEVVGPRARGLDEPGFDRRDVVVGGRARLRVDDEVQSREHGLGDAGDEVDAAPAESVSEDLLDPLPDVCVVAVERKVDEAGEETAERLAPHEEPHAPALAEVEDPERDLRELVL